MDQIILGLLVLIVVVILFKYSPSYFPSTSSDTSSKVTGVYEMLKQNKNTLEIIDSLKKSGVSEDQIGVMLSLAQSRLRDELVASGVKVETPK
jgi:hypothetical protein